MRNLNKCVYFKKSWYEEMRRKTVRSRSTPIEGREAAAPSGSSYSFILVVLLSLLLVSFVKDDVAGKTICVLGICAELHGNGDRCLIGPASKCIV